MMRRHGLALAITVGVMMSAFAIQALIGITYLDDHDNAVAAAFSVVLISLAGVVLRWKKQKPERSDLVLAALGLAAVAALWLWPSSPRTPTTGGPSREFVTPLSAGVPRPTPTLPGNNCGAIAPPTCADRLGG
jgi:hypothetical protein